MRRRIEYLIPVALLAAGAACSRARPPLLAPARLPFGTPIAAPFGVTWGEALGLLAEDHIAIDHADSAAGIIVSRPQTVTTRDAGVADCDTVYTGVAYYPTAATWTVRVIGDRSQSHVTASIDFVRVANSGPPECRSRRVWETAFEAEVRRRAESRR